MSRKSSSPSLREMELTTPLPCRHLSPASITSHLELSTMTGMRVISGSLAHSCRKRVIAATPSSIPSSMLTSRMLAPPRTWSSATSSAVRVVAAGDEPGELLGPGHVGALADHDEVRLGRDLQPFQARQPQGRAAGGLVGGGGEALHGGGDGGDVLRGGTAAATHQVDEAALGQLADAGPRWCRASRRIRRRRWAARRSGSSSRRRWTGPDSACDVGAHLAGAQGAVDARPTAAGRARSRCRRPRWSGPTGCGRCGR